ncbi:MAG: hypothetical protein R2731_10480 [Nocardioides sp.]
MRATAKTKVRPPARYMHTPSPAVLIPDGSEAADISRVAGSIRHTRMPPAW